MPYGRSVLATRHLRGREFLIDNLLVRIHFIAVMIGWSGIAPWEFELPFPGSLPSAFLALEGCQQNPSDPLPSRSCRSRVRPGLVSRVWGLECRVSGLGPRFWGFRALGFRV